MGTPVGVISLRTGAWESYPENRVPISIQMKAAILELPPAKQAAKQSIRRRGFRRKNGLRCFVAAQVFCAAPEFSRIHAKEINHGWH